MYYKDIAEMPIPTFAAMLFCYGMLADSILSEIRNSPGVRHPHGYYGSKGHKWHRPGVVDFGHVFTCCSVLVLLLALFLIASDGPEDVLMNSLASVFILEADDTFMAIVSGRLSRGHGGCAHMRTRTRAASSRDAARSGGWHTAMELGVFSYFPAALHTDNFCASAAPWTGNLPGLHQFPTGIGTDTLYVALSRRHAC